MATSDELRHTIRTAILRGREAQKHDGDILAILDALMPVVREALADAWDAGWTAGYRAQDYDATTSANPWRERP